jgi:uncharacterized protein YbjT (DUF2867 family)
MNVLLLGATGMLGHGVLLECLDDDRVHSVLAVGRSACGVTHPKLREHIRSDFFDFSDLEAEVEGCDACFFCLGVSSTGMDEATYHRFTFDIAAAVAATLSRVRPGVNFCFVSGQGADSTEQGRSMWARVKGKTENHLLALPLRTYVFRPGLVQPLRGARSKTRLYAMIYAVTRPLLPLLRRLFPRHVTTTVNLGRAMIQVAHAGQVATARSDERILETPDINALAGAKYGRTGIDSRQEPHA